MGTAAHQRNRPSGRDERDERYADRGARRPSRRWNAVAAAEIHPAVEYVASTDNGWLYVATYTVVSVPCSEHSSLQPTNGLVARNLNSSQVAATHEAGLLIRGPEVRVPSCFGRCSMKPDNGRICRVFADRAAADWRPRRHCGGALWCSDGQQKFLISGDFFSAEGL